MASDKTYVYCNVLPANYQSPYFYICDFDVKPGDIVVISIKNDSNEKVALVLDRNEYTEANAPYPPQGTKRILRPFGDNEPAELVKEKAKVEAEKAVRFKAADQLEKLATKEALLKYGVGKKKINDSKKKLKALIESMPDKYEALDDLIMDLSGGFQLSADGKTVTRFKASRVKGKAAIRIPSGVEVIEDKAFLRVKIDSLFLPKELKYLGKYTLRGPYGEPKDITSIEVEDGNECFFSDGIGFYSIENGKKRLECLANANISVYTAPDDVASFAKGAFSNGAALRQIILSDGTEEFDEYALLNTTEVEEVYIPKTLKKLHPKGWNTVSSYRIDEENEHLFRDEDSIYEVLEDGTYKLLTNLYTGKGKVLILEGTSVIGKFAFEEHKNFTKIEFPKSLRIIEESAFESTALKTLVVPDYVVSIGARAFRCCEELKNVTLSPNLESIASDAFEGCCELKKIKTDGKKKAFTFRNGVIKKISSGKTGGSSSVSNSQYAWMNGKIFVHTGLSGEDGREFEDIVTENGGDVRSSTVLATDYLVYNEYYDHETTKLRRARELQEQGKDIQIITYKEWLDMLEGGVAPSDGSVSVESEDSEAIAKAALEAAMQKDYFGEFAKEVVERIRKESVLYDDNVNDRANYDEANRVVSITTAFDQSTQDANLEKERLACAEELKEGDPVIFKLNSEEWEVTSKSGKSLGYLSWSLGRKVIPYLNSITVLEGSVASIMPKSKRRSNAEYAIGSVKFEIKERSIENLSEQDLITRTQFAYTITDTEAILVRWVGGEGIKKAVVPAVVEGKPVKTVHPGLFGPDSWTGKEDKLEEIVFSEGIQRIEGQVLFSIENLKKVVFPASVNYISPNVFSCKNGEDRDLHLSSKTIYVAPAGSYADKFLKDYKPDKYSVKMLTVFNDDSEATTDKLKMLAAFDFEPGDDGIVAKFKNSYILELDKFKEKNVTLPSEVNGKALEIFDLHCIPNFIQKIIVPATVISLLNMGSSTSFFEGGNGLDKIEIAEDNPMFWSDGYSVFSKDKKTLLRFMSFKSKEYVVPEGTEIIGRFAFGEMENLTKLVLPKSIKKIDSHAFYDCEKLADIQGIELVSEVGDRIFAGDWIRETIPYEQNTPVLILGSTVLRYNNLSEKVIKIPDGITRIGESAFGWNNDNDNVEEIILPSSVTVIENAAFRGRKKLKKVNIPEGVKEIPAGVFSYCEQMEVINIPASVEKIAFEDFPTYHAASSYFEERSCALRAIEVDPANKHYCSVNGMLLTADKSELLFVPNGVQGTGFEIPAGVKKIRDRLATDNRALEELILPASVTEIPERAFAQCRNLKKVVFPEGLETIGAYAFSDCKKLKTIVWPKSLKSIGDSAFDNCGLEELILPDTVEHIGSEAFAKTSIEKVVLPRSVRTLGWGAFSCVPEIEVYDSIDPEAGDASEGIDTINGHPNSMVGYIGMGPRIHERFLWECAASHQWVDYTIVVRSAETDEIKYKVWMGAYDSQRKYYCFLSSGWGHNATFAFDQLDEFFPKIRGEENKLQVARYRLEYPYELSETAKAKYEAYVKKNS